MEKIIIIIVLLIIFVIMEAIGRKIGKQLKFATDNQINFIKSSLCENVDEQALKEIDLDFNYPVLGLTKHKFSIVNVKNTLNDYDFQLYLIDETTKWTYSFDFEDDELEKLESYNGENIPVFADYSQEKYLPIGSCLEYFFEADKLNKLTVEVIGYTGVNGSYTNVLENTKEFSQIFSPELITLHELFESQIPIAEKMKWDLNSMYVVDIGYEKQIEVIIEEFQTKCKEQITCDEITTS